MNAVFIATFIGLAALQFNGRPVSEAIARSVVAAVFLLVFRFAIHAAVYVYKRFARRSQVQAARSSTLE